MGATVSVVSCVLDTPVSRNNQWNQNKVSNPARVFYVSPINTVNPQCKVNISRAMKIDTLLQKYYDSTGTKKLDFDNTRVFLRLLVYHTFKDEYGGVEKDFFFNIPLDASKFMTNNLPTGHMHLIFVDKSYRQQKNPRITADTIIQGLEQENLETITQIDRNMDRRGRIHNWLKANAAFLTKLKEQYNYSFTPDRRTLQVLQWLGRRR
jgi:hypothetical protein